MDWEKVGKICFQSLLFFIEWGFKICAVVAGLITLAAGGSFGLKLQTGFASLPSGLRYLFSVPTQLNKMGWLIHDYVDMGRELFQQTYGVGAIDQFMGTLNKGILFLGQISNNLFHHPFTTIPATLIVFLTFYALSVIIRFARQRGRGSILVRLEKRVGDQIFKRDRDKSGIQGAKMQKTSSGRTKPQKKSVKQLFSA